jgi:hypothetical protein
MYTWPVILLKSAALRSLVAGVNRRRSMAVSNGRLGPHQVIAPEGWARFIRPGAKGEKL